MADPPGQMDILLPALTTGKGFTVTVTVAVFTQPLLLVPVTVYVVVAAGLAVTDVPVDADRPVAGLHE